MQDELQNVFKLYKQHKTPELSQIGIIKCDLSYIIVGLKLRISHNILILFATLSNIW